MKTILITGASGFIGCALNRSLSSSEYDIKTIARADFNLTDSLKKAMSNVDVIIHLAARVHIMNDLEKESLAAFRKINVEGTKRLVELAIETKVKRFIFVSSLHVNGAVSPSIPFNEENKPSPQSPYATSKLEAEQYLNNVAKNTNMEIVIIRPPLVYGPKVKANFLSLLKLTRFGLPLPVGLLNNKRSMISVNNLVNFIICCIEHSNAANETFLISDDNDISTKELFAKLIKLFNKRLLFFPVPPRVLYILGILLGKKDIVDRLCSPLQVDITKAKNLLNWKPIQILDDGLKETVEWYKKEYL